MEDIKKRTLLGFFGGRRSWKPWMPGVAEDYYGRGIRNVLFEAFDNDQDIFVRNHIPHDEYKRKLKSSKFCFNAPGWAVWSPRTDEAIAAGCIPVILTDGTPMIEMPFEQILDWN